MEVIYRQTETLKKLENNPRSITEKQLQKLKESIQRNPDYFEARPISVSENGTFSIIIPRRTYAVLRKSSSDRISKYMKKELKLTKVESCVDRLFRFPY